MFFDETFYNNSPNALSHESTFAQLMNRASRLLYFLMPVILASGVRAKCETVVGPPSHLSPSFSSIVEAALSLRKAEFRIDGSTVRVKYKKRYVILPLLELQRLCTSHPEEDCLAVTKAYFAGALNENQNIIGSLESILKYKKQLDPFDPRIPLLRYHELREVETQKWHKAISWNKSLLQGLAGKQEIETMLANQLSYAAPESSNFVEVIPTPTDSHIEALCRKYRLANDDQRRYIRSLIDSDKGWALLIFAERAAVRAKQANNGALVLDGLTALAIDNLAQGDVRDSLVAISLLYHVAHSTNVEPTSLFKQVEAVSGSAMAQLLSDFLQQDDLDKVHLRMGWREVNGPNGIGYVWDMDPFR